MRSREATVAAPAIAALLAVLLMAPGLAGQGNIPACAQKLVPCASYMVSAKPAESCCRQLREVVRKELPCLCSLIGNTELLQAFQVNLTQALELPKHCGVTSQQSICTAVSTMSTSPGATGGKSGINGAAVACMGVAGVMGFLASWSLLG